MKGIQPPGLSVASASRIVLLSQREEEVVRLVADGLTDREIARKLKRRAVTVKRHLLQIFAKLGISSRVELIFYFYSKTTVLPRESHGFGRDEGGAIPPEERAHTES